jgi:hypothetical protein
MDNKVWQEQNAYCQTFSWQSVAGNRTPPLDLSSMVLNIFYGNFCSYQAL